MTIVSYASASNLTPQQQYALDWGKALAGVGYVLVPVTLTRNPDDGKKVPFFHLGRWKSSPRSSDPAQIEKWFWQYNPTGWAILCEESGIEIVDLDVKPDKNGWAWWASQGLPSGAFIQQTISAGFHFVWRKRADGRSLKQGANEIAPGVDTRNGGGLIFSAGSYVAGESGSYTIPPGCQLFGPSQLIEVPEEVLALGPAAKTRTRSESGFKGKDKDVALKLFTAEIAKVREAGRHNFRSNLMGAAMIGGRLCEDRVGWMTEDAVRDMLEQVCRDVWSAEPDGNDLKWIEQGLYDGPFGPNGERWYDINFGIDAAHPLRQPQMPPNVQAPQNDVANMGTASKDFSESYLAETMARDVLLRRFRHCSAMGWLEWDGRRWAIVDDKTPLECIRQWTKARMEQVMSTGDDGLIKWLSVQGTARRESLLKTARGIAGITVNAEQLDADPELLNTANCVVNLRTGEAWAHHPDFLMTKVTNGGYVAGYTHPDWDKAVTCLPDAERRWLQLRIGQAITGKPTPDGVLPLLHGTGSNGKSAFGSDGLLPALGDYAQPASHRLVSSLKAAGEHSTEVADLKGQRLLIAEELMEGRALDVTTIKRIQDVGVIKARLVYKDNMTFAASHSLFVTSNYYPIVAETDYGTWRRLALVSFPFHYCAGVHDGKPCDDPNRRPGDEGLKQRIKFNANGQFDAIVTWAVNGALAYHAAGGDGGALHPTDGISASTATWRRRNDVILAFADEQLVVDPTARVRSRDLFDAFLAFLAGTHQAAWSPQTFKDRLANHERFAGRVELDKVVKTAKPGLSTRPGLPSVISGAATEKCVIGVRFRTASDVLAANSG